MAPRQVLVTRAEVRAARELVRRAEARGEHADPAIQALAAAQVGVPVSTRTALAAYSSTPPSPGANPDTALISADHRSTTTLLEMTPDQVDKMFAGIVEAWSRQVSEAPVQDGATLSRVSPAEGVHNSPQLVVAEDEQSQAQRADSIRRALAAMLPEQRDVLVLRYYQDLSPREVAQHLGVTDSAATVLESSALRALAAELDAKESPQAQ